MLAAIYCAVFCVGAGLVCRHQCLTPAAAAATPPPLPGENLTGLGGWLILVGIGRVFGPFILLLKTIRSFPTFSLLKWHAMTNPGGVSYQPAWGPLLTLELLAQLSLVILGGFALVLFFQKRRIFPRWFIALMVFDALFVAGDMVGIQFIKTSSPALTTKLFQNLTQVVIQCGIWIPYMCVSRRVKATFVR